MSRMTSGEPLDPLTAGTFRDNLDSRFRLAAGPGPDGSAITLDLRLAEVTEHGTASAAFRAPFSLVFHGPLMPVLPQAIYQFEHDELGVLGLFIVPIGPAEPAEPGAQPSAMRYEVVFG